MAQYLLSVHTGAEAGPDTDAAPSEGMPADLLALEEDMRTSGAWLFSGRLTGPEVATVVRVSGGDMLTTDGPFVESKEHLAGFYLVEADDLDEALRWAGRITEIIGMPIEVRPFWDTKS